ncbi:MAG: hypothetical protein AAF682_10065 [Planctomycetota bacterium]
MFTRSAVPALSLALLSCAASSELREATPRKAAASRAQEAPAADAAEEAGPWEHRGVLVPAAPAAISLWPEAYTGELLVLEVLPHGSAVRAGDVLARLDPGKLDDAIADAELGLSSARVQHAGLLERNAVADEAAAAALVRAEAGLVRARRSFTGYKDQELAFALRADDLSRQREESWIADQLDELAQLEAMYEADELTDATEEIVLKRSRRDLALSRASSALSADRRGYRVELTDKLSLEARGEDVERKAGDLAHLRRTQDVDAAGRTNAVERSQADLARKERRLTRLRSDRTLLEVTAPRDGVLLHGSLRSMRAGGGPATVRRGDRLSARSDAFLVAAPSALDVALSVTETERAALPAGTGERPVLVRPLGGGDELAGTLVLGRYPASAAGGESGFDATVTLAEPAPAALVAGTHVTVELVEVER